MNLVLLLTVIILQSAAHTYAVKDSSCPKDLGDIVGLRKRDVDSPNLKSLDAGRGTYPFIASVFDTIKGATKQQCTGTLISPRHVLTSATCISRGTSNEAVHPNGVSVVAGDYDLCENDVECDSILTKIHRHPKYMRQPGTSVYDIAILEARDNLVCNDFVKPACLPLSTPVPKSSAIRIGWDTNEDTQRKRVMEIIGPEDLRFKLKHVFTTVSSSKCPPKDNSDQSYVCTDITKNYVGNYTDHHGSPLIQLKSGKNVIVGVIPLRTGPAQNEVIYADVFMLNKWITSIVPENEVCFA